MAVTKKIKILALIFLILAVVGMVIGALVFRARRMVDNRLTREQVFRLVEKNEALLLRDIEAGSFENSQKIYGIRRIMASDAKVVYVCGSRGFLDRGIGVDFRYLPDADSATIWQSVFGKDAASDPAIEVRQTDDTWDVTREGHILHIEKIKGDFYYVTEEFR